MGTESSTARLILSNFSRRAEISAGIFRKGSPRGLMTCLGSPANYLQCSVEPKTNAPLAAKQCTHWRRLPWRENVTTRRASGVLMVDVHSHTHLMLLLMESSTARSTSPSSSWKREPTAMSLHQL